MSINNFWACILDNQTAMQRLRPKIIILAAFMGKYASDDIATASSLYVLGFNFTIMHAVSHRSDYFLACSSKFNIEQPPFYLTITYHLTVIQIELPRIQFPTSMSDTKSLNTSLLEVIISSTNEQVFIGDVINDTLQIIFDVWWASMNVGSMQSIASNDSRHAPLWQLYLHCGIEETSG